MTTEPEIPPEVPPDQPDEEAKEQLLKESEERTLDPATRDLKDDTVERRRSDDLVTDAEAAPEGR